MSEMVERVAKTMFEKSMVGEAWEQATVMQKEIYRNDAKSAIEAMRNPTDEMLAAAEIECDDEHRWVVMIDEAMK